MAAALKSHWPDCEVTWVTDCAAESILRAQKNIDHVHRVRKGFLKRPSELWNLIRTLRRQSFDFCLDPQGLLKSSLVGFLSGAKHRIGFASGQSREQAWRLYHEAVEPTAIHLVERHLELLRPLGISVDKADFGWTEPESIAKKSDLLLKSVKLRPFDYYVINPGGGWASRRWSIDRHQGLIREAFQRYRRPCLVIWGDDEERCMASQIVAPHPEMALLAPATSLMELSGLIRRSRFLVSGDTGPMHLAAAVGTRCIALFGTTRSEYSGPYGSIHHRIQKRYDAGSSTYRRTTGNDAMMEIQIDDVLQAIDACEQTSLPNQTSFASAA
jgi:ADP-heptose:LPS heptosyltransferase